MAPALETLSASRQRTRALLSLCFRERDPLSEELELCLWNLQHALATLEPHHADVQPGWADITAGLSDMLNGLHRALSSSDSAGPTHYPIAALPVYTYLLESACPRFPTAEPSLSRIITSPPRIPAGDGALVVTGRNRAFESLKEALDFFRAGSPDVWDASGVRTNATPAHPDIEDRRRYANIIYKRLKVRLDDVLKRMRPRYGSEGSEALLAAYWMQASAERLATYRRTCSPERPGRPEQHQHQLSQAFLDIVKAAIALDRLRCLPDAREPHGLLRTLARKLEQDILGQISNFYTTEFQVPDYYIIDDNCSHAVALPWAFPEEHPQQRSGSTLPADTISPLQTPTSGFANQHELLGTSVAPAAINNTPGRPAGHGDTLSATGPILSPTASESAEPGTNAIPSETKGKARATVPGQAQAGVSESEPPLLELGSCSGLDASTANDGDVVHASEPLTGEALPVSELPAPITPDIMVMRPRRGSAGLQVSMLEQAVICHNIDQIEAEDGENELLDENVPEGEDPAPFSRGITSLVRAPRSHRSIPYASKLRVFRHQFTDELHIWTEFQRGDERSLVDYRFSRGTDFVPKYAFDDNSSEVVEAYFRRNGLIHGHRYRFEVSPRGSSPLYGFQGAVLGMIFDEEYRVANITLVKGIASKNDTLTNPRLQFWTDRSYSSQRVQSLGEPNSPTSSGGSPNPLLKDITVDFLDEFKSKLECSRLFVYSKTPSASIHVLFVDDRVLIRERSILSAKKQERTLHLEPNKRKGIEKLRVLELIAQCPGIPINLDGIHYADQDGPSFKEYRSIQLEFHTERDCREFKLTFGTLKARWDDQLAPALKVQQHQRDPHIKVRKLTNMGS